MLAGGEGQQRWRQGKGVENRAIVGFQDGGTSAVKCGLDGTSHFKGVSWHKKYSKWRAQIQIGGK